MIFLHPKEGKLTILRKKRKTLSITIAKDGTIMVYAPLKANETWIHQVLQTKRSWIEKHLQKQANKSQINIKDYLLGVPRAGGASMELDLQIAQKAIFERYSHFWHKISASLNPAPLLKYRKMKSRWGTYHSKGTITLNADLIHFPMAAIEYVIVHEICHAYEANHGPQFYELVSRHMPDWRERRRKLSLFLESGPI